MISLLHKARRLYTTMSQLYWTNIDGSVEFVTWLRSEYGVFRQGKKIVPTYCVQNIKSGSYLLTNISKESLLLLFLRTNLMINNFFLSGFQIVGLNATINSEHYVLHWLQCTMLLVHSCCNSENQLSYLIFTFKII